LLTRLPFPQSGNILCIHRRGCSKSEPEDARKKVLKD
jgi:hypothetical protein